MSTYRVKLTPYIPPDTAQTKYHDRSSFRVKIVASDVTTFEDEFSPSFNTAFDGDNNSYQTIGLGTAKIFGHRLTVVNSGKNQDEFCFVCSVADLLAYPEDTPAAGQDPPFFRKNTIDIYLPNPNITEITSQVAILMKSLSDRDSLEIVETHGT
jgi:hypothetical protein